MLVDEDAWFLAWQLGDHDGSFDAVVPMQHVPPQSLARPLKVAEELGMLHVEGEKEDEALARMRALRGRRSQAQLGLCVFGDDSWVDTEEGKLPAGEPLVNRW